MCKGCLKLKTVIEIRRSSARDILITESIYLVLNSLLDWTYKSLGSFQHETVGAAGAGFFQQTIVGLTTG